MGVLVHMCGLSGALRVSWQRQNLGLFTAGAHASTVRVPPACGATHKVTASADLIMILVMGLPWPSGERHRGLGVWKSLPRLPDGDAQCQCSGTH